MGNKYFIGDKYIVCKAKVLSADFLDKYLIYNKYLIVNNKYFIADKYLIGDNSCLATYFIIEVEVLYDFSSSFIFCYIEFSA